MSDSKEKQLEARGIQILFQIMQLDKTICKSDSECSALKVEREQLDRELNEVIAKRDKIREEKKANEL